MDGEEIARSAALERKHWWYAARRVLVRRAVADWSAGRAIDVGWQRAHAPIGARSILARHRPPFRNGVALVL